MTSHGTASGLPGALRLVSAPAVGAGVDASLTVPATVRWKLLGIALYLTTDATVINRTPVVIANASNFLSAGTRVAPVTAGSAADPSFFTPGQTVTEITTAAGHFDPMPPPIFLLAGDTIYSLITNLQAGDQINGLAAYVEEWIEP